MLNIRKGVFETNSSSTHSITMCSREEYNKREAGELLYWKWDQNFMTKEETMKKLRKEYPEIDWDDEDSVNDVFEDEQILSCEAFFDDNCYETYFDSYTTKEGSEVVAFGYYGYN